MFSFSQLTLSSADSAAVQKQLESVDLEDMAEPQRRRLKQFVEQKVVVGDLTSEEQLEKLGELGVGNGGIVAKVRHKPTNVIMARKVIHHCLVISN